MAGENDSCCQWSRPDLEVARELRHTNEIKRVIAEEVREPSSDFVRFLLYRFGRPGRKKLVEQFTPLVHQASVQFVDDRIGARLKSALDRGDEQPEKASEQRYITGVVVEFVVYRPWPEAQQNIVEDTREAFLATPLFVSRSGAGGLAHALED